MKKIALPFLFFIAGAAQAGTISLEGYANVDGDILMTKGFIAAKVDVYANGKPVAEGVRCKRADPCVIDIGNATKVKVCRGGDCGGVDVPSTGTSRIAYVFTGHTLKVYGQNDLEVIDYLANK